MTVTIEKAMTWVRKLHQHIRDNPDPAWAPLAGWTDEQVADELQHSDATNASEAGRHISKKIRGFE